MNEPPNRLRQALGKLLSERTAEFYVAALLLWLVPAVALAVLGVLYLWQSGWFWFFSGGVLMLTLLSWSVGRLLSSAPDESAGPAPHLDPRLDWSDHDQQVWKRSLAHIEEARLVDTPWNDIPEAALTQLLFVARTYHGADRDAEYAFTLPEFLLMLETWSRAYRAQVVSMVPFVQDLQISGLMRLSRTSENVRKIYRYAGPVIRAMQLAVNPASGLLREASSHVAMSMFSGLGKHMQRNMKVILFEQVTHVAIDLYSGRLKLSEQELAAYTRSLAVPDAVELAPLKVLVVGQVNAGKSSLVNALSQECVTEIDPLPSTAGFSFHRMRLPNDLDILLVDTPGLDGTDATENAILEEAVRADLILWTSQANQPAKDLDRKMMKRWTTFFDQNLPRRKPPVLLVTTHNDLLRPRNEWRPPYDLSESDDPKVRSMLEALHYTHEQLNLATDDPALPIALPPGDQPFNMGLLRDLLVSLGDQARAAQLNRQRIEAVTRTAGLSRTLQQTAGLIRFGRQLVLSERPADSEQHSSRGRAHEE
jgi:uncharacterized protein